MKDSPGRKCCPVLLSAGEANIELWTLIAVAGCESTDSGSQYNTDDETDNNGGSVRQARNSACAKGNSEWECKPD